jgi:hypothetical protein
MNIKEEVSNAMRPMAWERAKGELNSMLHTYWRDDRFEPFSKLLEDFIKEVEKNGLHE